MNRLSISLLVVFITTSCFNNSKSHINTQKLNNWIDESYKRSRDKTNCIVNFSDFIEDKWEKMYVFNIDHYPEADDAVVSQIAGVDYEGGKTSLENRLILFVHNDAITYDVLSDYNLSLSSEDEYTLFVNFIVQEGFPEYLNYENSRFRVIYDERRKVYFLKHLDNS